MQAAAMPPPAPALREAQRRFVAAQPRVRGRFVKKLERRNDDAPLRPLRKGSAQDRLYNCVKAKAAPSPNPTDRNVSTVDSNVSTPSQSHAEISDAERYQKRLESEGSD
jgi:hypothetical protein